MDDILQIITEKEDSRLIKIIENEEKILYKYLSKEEDRLVKLRDILYQKLTTNKISLEFIKKEEKRLINLINIKRQKILALSSLKYKSYSNCKKYTRILDIETDIKYCIFTGFNIAYKSQTEIRNIIYECLNRNGVSNQCYLCNNLYKYPHFQQNYMPIIVYNNSKCCTICNNCVKTHAEKYYQKNIGAAVLSIKKKYLNSN
jgi:hypothetical protein